MNNSKFQITLYGFGLSGQYSTTIDVPPKIYTLKRALEFAKKAWEISGLYPQFGYIKECSENTKVCKTHVVVFLKKKLNQNVVDIGERILVDQIPLGHFFPTEKTLSKVYVD